MSQDPSTPAVPMYPLPRVRLEVTFPDGSKATSVVVEMTDDVDPVDIGRMAASVIGAASTPGAFHTAATDISRGGVSITYPPAGTVVTQ